MPIASSNVMPVRTEPVQVVAAALASAALLFLLFLYQGHVGFNLWDEGFLWYGAQRVLLGEVPIRDFMAYDPGRYLWAAAWMTVLGDSGILTLRIVVALFQWIGLTIGLLLIIRNQHDNKYIGLFVYTAILLLWMLPRHKLFDISLSIILVATLAALIQQPSSRRYFIAGLIVGLVAIFGRNHGMYGVVGCASGMAYLAYIRKGVSLPRGIIFGLSGIVLGYLPLLAGVYLIPGFASAFLDSIRFLFEVKTTNLPLPIPWPWRVPFGQFGPFEYLRQLLIGGFFLALPAFILAMLFHMARKNIQAANPVLVASALMAIPYAHYAYSRADVGHLAQGIFPFLIGALAIAACATRYTRLAIVAALLASSAVVTLPMHPGWVAQHEGGWKNIQILRDPLLVDPDTAANHELLTTLTDRYAKDGRSFIATPNWPGAYAAFERKSPMWEIFALFPRSPAFEEKEIARIRLSQPGFAVVMDFALDDRDELRFRNTHPLTERYIREHFIPVSGINANPNLHIYKAPDFNDL